MMTELISLEMRSKFFYRYLLSMEQKLKEKNSLCHYHYNFKHVKNSTAADLGGGCRGCIPPPLEMKPTFSFVFAFIFCLLRY